MNIIHLREALDEWMQYSLMAEDKDYGSVNEFHSGTPAFSIDVKSRGLTVAYAAYLVVKASTDYAGAIDIEYYADEDAFCDDASAILPTVTEFTFVDAVKHLTAFIEAVSS